jgi:uncharacterized repeat protein (TIGR03847 family)
MADFTYDLESVHRITANAIGPRGQRVFYVQVRKGTELLSMLAEKEQVRALAEAVEQFLDDLGQKNPQLATTDDILITDMRLEEPIEPVFRIVQMGLGYDTDRDLMVLVLQGQEDDTEGEPVLARLSATRSQMRALSVHAAQVVAAGRPMCVQYPRPCDYRQNRDDTCPFCPDRN